jgi:hypothetical protein
MREAFFFVHVLQRAKKISPLGPDGIHQVRDLLRVRRDKWRRWRGPAEVLVHACDVAAVLRIFSEHLSHLPRRRSDSLSEPCERTTRARLELLPDGGLPLGRDRVRQLRFSRRHQVSVPLRLRGQAEQSLDKDARSVRVMSSETFATHPRGA